jgi:hypothetical protein
VVRYARYLEAATGVVKQVKQMSSPGPPENYN